MEEAMRLNREQALDDAESQLADAWAQVQELEFKLHELIGQRPRVYGSSRSALSRMRQLRPHIEALLGVSEEIYVLRKELEHATVKYHQARGNPG